MPFDPLENGHGGTSPEEVEGPEKSRVSQSTVNKWS